MILRGSELGVSLVFMKWRILRILLKVVFVVCRPWEMGRSMVFYKIVKFFLISCGF